MLSGFFGTALLEPSRISAQPASNAPPIMPPGLIGYWAAEGSANDSCSTNHGSLYNGAAFDSGVVGYAFALNGMHSYVRIPGSKKLDPGRQVTIELWMKASPSNAMQTYQGLVCSDFYLIEIANGFGQPRMGVQFGLSTDSGSSIPSPQTADANGGGFPVTPDVWHHIVGTYDGAKLQLYVDGKPAGHPFYHTGAISPMLPDDGIAIGSEERRAGGMDPSHGRYFNGLIDEVAIYNRALPPDEILAHYRAGLAGESVSSAAPAAAKVEDLSVKH